MIVRTEDILEASKFFKSLIQRSPNNMISNLIEFASDGSKLSIKMSDGSYELLYKIDSDEKFNCTISSELFLDLIPRITSETLEFEVKDEFLLLKGSGTYKFPAILTGDSVVAIPHIDIESVTSEWTIDGNILNSIYVHNSKQLSLGTISSPIQKLYYVDKEGAITFTSGACVNEFDLGSDIKILLSDSCVKFFSFMKNKQVDVKFGYSVVSNNNQPRITFTSSNIEATYILPFNDFTLSQIPVKAIRGRAHTNYVNSISMDALQIKGILDRLDLFVEKDLVINMSFSGNILNLSTENEKILETVYLLESVKEDMDLKLSIKDFKSSISNSYGKYFTFKCSKSEPAVVVCSSNVYNIIQRVED